ncbi:MAG: hypothetical protein AABZ30_00420, partial [Myxococcota bacterium]
MADEPEAKPEPDKRKRRGSRAAKVDGDRGEESGETAAPVATSALLTPDDEALDDAVKTLIEAARAAEALGVDKGIEAWRKVAHAGPRARLPRRELGRIYRAAGRWNPLVESLKELVERLPAERTDEKVATLFEMTEVYRERLKLDVMVLQTLNQVLATDPKSRRALDALEAQYDALKRWPDLIKVLEKKAALLTDTAAQVEMQLRIAGLYLEKFSNQAEAIKAYERALELDPASTQALEFLKQMYERRRDWDKLIAAHQRELLGVSDAAERVRRRVEVAKLASDKVKKAPLSIELWRQVLEEEPEHALALAELEKLYERERAWGDLAGVLEKQIGKAPDAAARVAALTKLAILYGEKQNDPERAIVAWQRVLADDADSRRAGDALRKLYGQARRFDDLEQVYAPTGKWDELVRVLERQAEVDTDPQVRVELHFRCARLWTERLGKEDRAARCYEKVLAVDEENLKAARALVPIYSAAGDARRLAGVLAVDARHTDAGPERLEKLRRLAEIHERDLKDLTGAFGFALEAVALGPDEAWARDAAERLAAATERQADLAKAYEQAQATTARVPMLEALVRLYEGELSDADAALRAATRLLDAEPSSLAALDALERLHTGADRFADLLAILERKRPLVADGEQLRELLFKRAYLLEEELKDAERAIGAWRDLLDVAPADGQALRALDGLYQARGATRELAEILEREIAAAATEDTAAICELKMRLGRARASALGDRRGALECFRDALELDPVHEGARAALEPYLDYSELQVDAARVLEPIYRAAGDMEKLVGTLEVRADHESDPVAAVEILQEIARAWAGPLAEPSQAFSAWERALRLDPGSADVLASLDGLAAVDENRAVALAALLEEILALGSSLDRAVRRELLVRAAAVHEDRLGDAAAAVGAWRRALDLDPSDETALAALERIYTAAEAWSDLLEIYQHRIADESDAARRQELHFRTARIHDEMLADADGAIAAYRAILADDDANLRALRALDRILVAAGRDHDLADVLGREIALAEAAGQPAERAPLLVRLGKLREEKLGEIEAAVDTFRQALAVDASSDDARASLERYLAHPEHRVAAAEALEPVYRARGDAASLVAALEILAGAALSPDRRVAQLREVASLRETEGDADAAFAALGRALAEDPVSGPIRQELERLARQVGWERLIHLYEAAAARPTGRERGAAVADEELRADLLTRVAEVWEQALGDPASAAAVYERIALAASASPRSLAALDALERIYVATDQMRPLVSALSRKVEALGDVAAQKETCFKAAQVLEDVLEDAPGAVEVYRRVLEIDPEDVSALDALERLLIRLERWPELRDVYIRKAEVTREPGERKRMLYVLGQVYDHEIGDRDKAIETYRGVLDVDPDDGQAMEALERLYGAAERWHDLIGVLEWEAAHALHVDEAVALRHRVGEIASSRLSDLPRAVEAYRQALSVDPTHEPTLVALEAMLVGRTGPEIAPEALAAGQVLASIYEREVEWEKLARVLDVLADFGEDDERLAVYAKLAAVCELQLGDAPRAMDARARAFRLRSDDAATLAELERLAAATGRFAQLVELYQEEASRSLSPRRAADLALRVARVQDEALADPEAAALSYRQALDAEGDSGAALSALERIYQRLDRPADLAEVLARRVASAGAMPAAERADLWLRLGRLRAERLGDPRGALDCWREVIACGAEAPAYAATIQALEALYDPEAGGALALEIARALEPHYVEVGDWAKLAHVGEALFAGAEGRDERRVIAARFSELAERRLGDAALALDWWGRALRDDPSSAQAADEMERLAELTGGWEDLAARHVDLLEAVTEPSIRRALLLRLGRVFEEEMRDVERAEGAYRVALETDPSDADTLERLDHLYTEAGMHAQLAEVLARRVEISVDPDAAVALELRLGRAREQSGDDAGAIGAWRAALDRDPRDARALEALERAHLRRAEWSDLYAVYERMLDMAPSDAEQGEISARMGKVAFDGLGDAARAEELWRRVLALRGEDALALSELAAIAEAGGRYADAVSWLEREGRVVAEPA